MTAIPAAAGGERPDRQGQVEWAQIAALAPAMAVTMRRYLAQVATFLAPRSVEVADISLRILARWLVTTTDVVSVADIARDDIEDFKIYLAGRAGVKGGQLSANTHRQRLRTLRAFFERIIEWTGPKLHPATRSSTGTCRNARSRCRASSMTATPRN